MAAKKQPPKTTTTQAKKAKKEEKPKVEETPFETFLRFGGSGNQSTNNLLEALCKKTGL